METPQPSQVSGELHGYSFKPEDLAAIAPAAIAAESETAASEQRIGRTIRAWRWTVFWGKRAFAFVTTVSTIALVVWILGLVAEATLQRHSLVIEPIAVPKRLADDGFSTEVVTQRLRDAIQKVQDRATTTMAKSRVDVSESIPDVTIPKAGVSVEGVAASLRRLLPDSWQHEITGELVVAGSELSVRMRLNGKVAFEDATATTASDAVGTLIERAAFALVKKTQPYVAASYLFETDDLGGASFLTDQIIATVPLEDENAMRAYNLKGLIAAKQHDEAKAEAFFLKFPNSPITRTNLGNLRSDQHRLDEAINE
jgi:hypothetical protein